MKSFIAICKSHHDIAPGYGRLLAVGIDLDMLACEAYLAAFKPDVTYDGLGREYVDGLRYVNDEVGYADQDEEYY